MTSTGKAVIGDDGVVAAAAFDADRTDPDTLCVRYITVRRTDRATDSVPDSSDSFGSGLRNGASNTVQRARRLHTKLPTGPGLL